MVRASHSEQLIEVEQLSIRLGRDPTIKRSPLIWLRPIDQATPLVSWVSPLLHDAECAGELVPAKVDRFQALKKLASSARAVGDPPGRRRYLDSGEREQHCQIRLPEQPTDLARTGHQLSGGSEPAAAHGRQILFVERLQNHAPHLAIHRLEAVFAVW